MTELDPGLRISAPEQAVAPWWHLVLDGYINSLRKLGNAPNTLDLYRRDVYRFFSSLDEKIVSLNQITPDDFEAHFSDLSINSGQYAVRRHKSALRGFFSWASEQELLDTDVYESFQDMKRDSRQIPAVLTDEEVDRLLQEASKNNDPRDLALFRLARQPEQI